MPNARGCRSRHLVIPHVQTNDNIRKNYEDDHFPLHDHYPNQPHPQQTNSECESARGLDTRTQQPWRYSANLTRRLDKVPVLLPPTKI